MGMIVAVAIYGAALGFLTGPGLRPVALAAASAAGAQYGALWFSQTYERQPGMEGLAWTIRAALGARPEDLTSTLLVAAIAAGAASILAGIVRSGEQRRRGRRIAVLED